MPSPVLRLNALLDDMRGFVGRGEVRLVPAFHAVAVGAAVKPWRVDADVEADAEDAIVSWDCCSPV